MSLHAENLNSRASLEDCLLHLNMIILKGSHYSTGPFLCFYFIHQTGYTYNDNYQKKKIRASESR